MSDSAPQTGQTLREEIVEILARETTIDASRFSPETKLTDLEIASIDLVQAIFAIETRFDIEIPPGIEAQDATVADLLSHIEALIAKRQAATTAPAELPAAEPATPAAGAT